MKRPITLEEAKMQAVRINNQAPEEVRLAAKEINNRIKEMDHLEIEVDDLTQLLVTEYCGEWCICTNYEDGCSSTFLIDGTWFYRDPYEGVDTVVPGGFGEVVDNWTCHFTG